MAETTTAGRERAKRLTIDPTCRIRAAPESDVPPNFMTIIAGARSSKK